MRSYANLKMLFPYIIKSKKYFIMGIIGMIFVSAITAPIPYFIGKVLDIVVMKDATFDHIKGILIIILLIYILKFCINIAYQYLFTKLQQDVVNGIRMSMIEKIIDAPLISINSWENGYILSRIGEAQQVGALFSPTIISSFVGIIEIVFCLCMMFYINITLSVVAILILPIYYIMSKIISKKITLSTIKLQENAAQLNADVFETLNGIEEIKLLNIQHIQLKKIREKVKTLIKSAIHQSLSMVSFIQGITLASDLVTIGVLALAGFLIINGDISIGVYTAFSIYIGKILGVTQSVGTFEITIKPICATIDRLKEFLSLKSESSINIISEKWKHIIKKLSFQDLCFGYNKDNFVINNFTETFNTGDKIQLIGKNGSGKSTLIKLITGLYSPNLGQIFFNDIDFNTLNKLDIRGRIGIVSQNIFLFKGTMLDNILIGTKKTKHDVINLVEAYDLNEYIKRFPKGLDTNIVQNGVGVSGGQAQIIAFLRAIIEKKDILILDEATSNMDIETSKKIVNILGNNTLCNILIIVSHHEMEYDFINRRIYL